MKAHLVLAVAMIGTTLTAAVCAEAAGIEATSTTGALPELRVAVIVVPPYVVQQNGSLTGFNIELWNEIAGRLKRKTSYQIEPDADALIEAMGSKRADLTAAPMPITSAFDELFDFSYPVLETGQQVMVRDTQQQGMAQNPIWDMLRLMLSRTTAVWLGMALLLVLIPAHVVWLLERGREDGMISGRKYFPGIFEAVYWGMSTLSTQAETMPRQWLARALAIFWMFAGVVFVASYTAQLTTALTVEQIRGAIEGPDDLPGKRVAALAYSPAAAYLREHQARLQECPTIDQVFNALLDKKVDAVFAGTQILRYYAAHEGKGRVKVVGPEINRAPVAIMVQLNSPLRKQIDAAMLALREDGSYQRIYDKWFGSP